MEWNKLFSDIGKRRKPLALREGAKLLIKKDVIYLGGGAPNPLMFHFESASFKLCDGTKINLSPDEMYQALQYGATEGMPALLVEMEKLVRKFHNPPKMNERDICITNGCQDGLSKTLQLFISSGDPVLMQRYIYPGFFSVIQPYNPIYLYFEEDEKGIVPRSLRTVLRNWASDKTNKKPKVLYTIPNNSNPTGVTTTGERRQEIYKIAQEYNLIIIEDDAYYYLNYEEKYEPSYLSMDVDCRVVHLDSFSKIIAPGFRIGYVCAAKEVTRKIVMHLQSSVQQASSFSQMVVYKLLLTWNEKGFESSVEKIKNFYKQRRNCMLEAASKWLTGLAEWNVPSGGMFLWLKVLGIKDAERCCQTALTDYGVVAYSGIYFMPEESINEYIRVSFTLITPEQIDEGIRKLAIAIREEKLKITE